MLGFKFRCIWFVKDSHSAYQTVHQLTCSLFQVTNCDSIPYQIPVGSDRFTVILVPATLSTMQVSDDSEFSGAAFFNPKIQNILRDPFFVESFVILSTVILPVSPESLIYYL